MARTYNADTYIAHRFMTAREQFALRKNNKNAADLLRCALNASGADLINDEEQEGVIFDVIEFLESR